MLTGRWHPDYLRCHVHACIRAQGWADDQGVFCMSTSTMLSWLPGSIPDSRLSCRHDSLPCGEWTIINSHILPHTLYRGRPHVDCPGSAGTGSTVEKTSPPEQRNEPSPSGRSLTHASCSVCILLHLWGEEEREMGRGRKEEKWRGGSDFKPMHTLIYMSKKHL